MTINDTVFVSPLFNYIVGSGVSDTITWSSEEVITTTPDGSDCGTYSWSIIDTDTNSEPNIDVFFIDTTLFQIYVQTDNVEQIKTYNFQVQVEYVDLPETLATKDITVIIDFPCDLGNTYELYFEPVTNREYYIGETMVVDYLENSITANPNYEISGVCWSYNVYILPSSPLPADDLNAITIDNEKLLIETFTELETSAGEYHIRVAAVDNSGEELGAY